MKISGIILFKNGKRWKLEETYIVFVQVKEPFSDNSYHRKNIGLNHLAFYARSRQHVDDMTQKLKNKSIPILYTEQHPFPGGRNHYAVYFEDLDRIKVELIAPDLSKQIAVLSILSIPIIDILSVLILLYL